MSRTVKKLQHVSPSLELLEDRVLLSTGIVAKRNSNGRSLYIVGTSTDDTIQVEQVPGQNLLLVNGKRVSSRHLRAIVVLPKAGNDLVDLSKVLTIPTIVKGGDGDDEIIGGNKKSTLYGEKGNDALKGGTKDDLLIGGLGNDTLDGQEGNDTLDSKKDNLGDDTLLGGDGDDLLYALQGQDQPDGGDGKDHLLDFVFQDAVITKTSYTLDGVTYSNSNNIETFVLYGSEQDNKIDASAYDLPITIYGGKGNDVLLGGSAKDKIFGENGDDKLYGNQGDDLLVGNRGYDYLDGGEGNADFLDGGSVKYDTVVSGWNARYWAVNGAKYRDIGQTGTGTCAFLAALAGASSQIGLRSRIRYTGTPYYYKVLLFDYNGNNPRWHRIYFDGNLVKSSSGVQVDPETKQDGEYWVLLYQRAYMKALRINYLNGDAVRNFGGDVLFAPLGMITGRYPDIDLGSFFSGSINMGKMASKLAQGKIVIAGTKSSTSSLIVPYHAYWVKGVSGSHVSLFNPYGVDGGKDSYGDPDDGLVTVTIGQFLRNFDDYAFA